jgi:hypothetical protein
MLQLLLLATLLLAPSLSETDTLHQLRRNRRQMSA